MAELASKYTELNSMRPDSAAGRASLPDLSLLERQGYRVYPVGGLRVLNVDPWAAWPDPPWHRAKLGSEGHDVLLSGTYTYDLPQRYHMNPVGVVMRNGELDTLGLERSSTRGGVAVLTDETIVMGRARGIATEDLQSTFGQGKLTVRDFMGGGALLVEYGQPVASHDLREQQRFTSGAGGIEATQMQRSDHVVFGVRRGQAFAMLAEAKTARDIRGDLLKVGFSTVVKFAGGSACFARERDGFVVQGVNSVGFGVRVRRY